MVFYLFGSIFLSVMVIVSFLLYRKKMQTIKLLTEWMISGVSLASMTILSVMMDVPNPEPSVPWDTVDFRRCCRLLKVMPQWRNKMPIVAQFYPRWQPYIDNWEYLESLSNDIRPEAHGELFRLLMKFGNE